MNESVWDYPRPPAVEDSARLVRVEFAGVVVAQTHHARRVLETSHPPVYYVPPEDVRGDLLTRSDLRTWCEWKGEAAYFHLKVADRLVANACWTYPKPTAGFEAIAGYFAFYPSRVDCFLDEEKVTAQPGDFYGGWITRDITGPFKGTPGTSHW